MYSKRSFVGAVVIAWGNAFSVSIASAADGPGPTAAASDVGLEEIVVTARQREEKLATAPISVDAFSEKVVERAGIKYPADFIALVPSMTFSQTTNQGDTAVQIRGIIQPRDTEPSYALIIDGITQPNVNALNRPLNDIQDIEVVKGPQGALYGRNAIGGAIIINTKPPTNELSGRFEGSLANGNESRFSGSVSGPVIDDKLFFRVGASDLNREGYFNNVTLHRKEDPYHEKTADARLLWKPTDDLTVDARINWGKIDGYSIIYHLQYETLNPETGVITGKAGGGVNTNVADNTWFNNVLGVDFQDRQEAAIKAEYQLPIGALALTTAYTSIFESAGGDGPFNNAAFKTPGAPNAVGIDFSIDPTIQPAYSATRNDNPQIQDRNEIDKTVELRFTSPAKERLRTIAGVSYAHIDREVALATTVDEEGFVIPDAINPVGSFNPTRTLTWNQFINKAYAVYANAAYDIVDNLEATLALRWDKEDREGINLVPHIVTPALADPASRLYNRDVNSAGPLNCAGLAVTASAPDPACYLTPVADGDPSRIREKSFSKFQPKYTLRYKLNEDNALYATYGVAFRSGGFNPAGSRALIVANDNPNATVRDDFKAETSKSVEIGVKTAWLNDRLTANIAVYSTKVDNAHNFENYPNSGARVVTTIERVDIKGAELESRAHITDGLDVNASYGYTNAKIKADDNGLGIVGNTQAYVPQYTINLGAQYLYRLTATENVVTRVAFQRIGKMWFNAENTPGSARDPINLTDASIGLESGHWAFRLYGKNIFNLRYNQDSVVVPGVGGFNLNYPSRAFPGIYGVSASYQF